MLKDYTNQLIETASRYKPQQKKGVEWASIADSLKSIDTSFKTNDLASALESGDEEAINKAKAALDPTGYARLLEQEAQRAEDRQWALEDAERKQQNALELMREQNANAFALENLRNQNARGLAEFKAGLGGQAASNPFEKSLINKIASSYGENVSKAQSTYDDYANADRLLDKIDTGAKYLIPGKEKLDSALNPDVAEFLSVQNKLIPTMRPTGSGSTSDKDMEIFAKATFGITKPKEANRNIIRGRMAAAENERDMEQLRAQWISAGGSVADFDAKWRDYVNNNPIFSNEDGKLNKNRKNAYDWFTNPQPSLKQFNSGGYVKVKAPDGRIVNVPESELENALSQGGQRI